MSSPKRSNQTGNAKQPLLFLPTKYWVITMTQKNVEKQATIAWNYVDQKSCCQVFSSQAFVVHRLPDMDLKIPVICFINTSSDPKKVSFLFEN